MTWPPKDPVIWQLVGPWEALHPDHLVEFTFEGELFRSVQHAYQASKAPAWRERIQRASTPREAWELGRQAPFQPDWDARRVAVMSAVVLRRFVEDKAGRELLRSSGEMLLVHGYDGEPEDTFWGVDLRTGEGRNRYGDILTAIRKATHARHHS
jgi:ribA/ribD-fused uncharacterized protein